jgi:hypothetical protein
MSQTVSQITNLGTMTSRQVPIVLPLWAIETPTDRVCALAAPPFYNPDRTVGLY